MVGYEWIKIYYSSVCSSKTGSQMVEGIRNQRRQKVRWKRKDQCVVNIVSTLQKLPSGKRLRPLRSKTFCQKTSFFPTAVGLINKAQVPPLTQTLAPQVYYYWVAILQLLQCSSSSTLQFSGHTSGLCIFMTTVYDFWHVSCVSFVFSLYIIFTRAPTQQDKFLVSENLLGNKPI